MNHSYHKITEQDRKTLSSLVSNDTSYIDTNDIKYASDATENLSFEPDLVLKPKNTEEVSNILSYCNEKKILVTPRAGGTGLVGGALAVLGGIILSVEKMNEILEIDTENHQVTVEAGVINYNLQQALEERNLFYPPDPSSWQSSFISGNIATNAGGPRAVKYGVASNYVLNLEIVLANGEVIWTGANTLKNVTAYNLTQYFVGSEGTLGIITKAVLRVIPKPRNELCVLILFCNLDDSIFAVNQILNFALNPAVLEFIEEKAIQFSMNDSNWINLKGFEACLLIVFDGNIIDSLYKKVEQLNELLSKYKIGEILVAEGKREKQKLWSLRRTIVEKVKAKGYTIEQDTVVPRSKMAELVRFAHILAKRNQMQAVCYGHAGDGNLHIRFNHPVHKNSYQNQEIKTIMKELFTFVKHLNGTITAEHGIGLIQKDYLPIVLSQNSLQLQKNIKMIFDPNGILNLGKIF